MLPEGAIEARHIWKRFRADRRRSMLRDELQRLRARIAGGNAGWQWALREINVHAEPGDSIGLFGVNGSGKSTLLKILTRIMYPYAGSVEVSGRVGALIEVSAGIHPELTGRENVYLYGSLLGLPRKKVVERFDEITGFAQLEDAIDRQVKFYSSGMKMRLGFAVSAFLEPDILLVDEVLAVGDASFQQRCLDRMRDMLSQGTTLILVSHDLAAIEATCERGIWLHQGSVVKDGPVRETLAAYKTAIEESAEASVRFDTPINVVSTEVAGPDGGIPRTQETLDIKVVLESAATYSGRLFIGISEGPSTPVFSVRRDLEFPAGKIEARCSIAHLPLPRGRYYLWMGVFGRRKNAVTLLPWHPGGSFEVMGPDLDPAPGAVMRPAPVYVHASWETEPR